MEHQWVNTDPLATELLADSPLMNLLSFMISALVVMMAYTCYQKLKEIWLQFKRRPGVE